MPSKKTPTKPAAKKAGKPAKRRTAPKRVQENPASSRARPTGLAIGTTLTRAWKGTTYTLTVTEHAFEMNGHPYRSLSAAATAITGTNWNGHVFWGLKKRKANR